LNLFGQLDHSILKFALFTSLESVKKVLAVLSPGECLVHGELVRPVLGPHAEVLLLKGGLLFSDLGQPGVELFRLLNGKEDILAVRDGFAKFLLNQQRLLEEILRPMVL
jgi:hypothetical protein